METFLHHVAHSIAEAFDSNAAYHLVAESIAQHSDCNAFADATSLQVKEGLLVQLSYRASMRTLHIVVIDFQEWASIYMGLVGEKNITIGLIGLRFDGTILNQNMSIKTGTGRIVYYALIQLSAETVRERMLHKDIIVTLLVSVHQVQPVGFTAASLAKHAYLDIVADMSASKCDGTHVQLRVALHSDCQLGLMVRWGKNSLKAIEHQIGILLQFNRQILLIIHDEVIIVLPQHEEGGILRGTEYDALLMTPAYWKLLFRSITHPIIAPYVGQLVFPNHAPISSLIHS